MSSTFSHILLSDQFREEVAVSEVQARLAQLLEDKGVSRAELARRLDVSRARVTQIFSDEAKNFTLRLLIRSYLALDEEPIILARSEYEDLKLEASKVAEKSVTSSQGVLQPEAMTEELIARLLAGMEGMKIAGERRDKRTSGLDDWAQASANVIPFRAKAHG